MATKNRRADTTAYRITEPMDGEGTCALHHPATDTTYRVVDYGDPLVREKLSTRAAGETVRLALTPADPDALDWIATRARPGAPPTPGLAGGHR